MQNPGFLSAPEPLPYLPAAAHCRSHHGDPLSLRSGWLKLMGVTDQVCQPAPALPIKVWACATVHAVAKATTVTRQRAIFQFQVACMLTPSMRRTSPQLVAA